MSCLALLHLILLYDILKDGRRKPNSTAPKTKNAVCALSSHAKYFLLSWKIPEKLADDKCSSITKGSIYHIKRMYIQSLSIEVNWPEM